MSATSETSQSQNSAALTGAVPELVGVESGLHPVIKIITIAEVQRELRKRMTKGLTLIYPADLRDNTATGQITCVEVHRRIYCFHRLAAIYCIYVQVY